MNTIKIIFLILTISLSSCVFLTENSLEQTINANNFLNRFPQNQKAIVILRLNGQRGGRIYLCPHKNIIANDFAGCRAIHANNQYKILMLNPHLYYLFPQPEIRPIFSKIKIAEQAKYLSTLEVKAGEIIYAGDINYRRINSIYNERNETSLNDKLIVNDRFELVQKLLSGKNTPQKEKLFTNQIWEINYLIKEYPSLEHRFKTRLINNFNPNNLDLENKKPPSTTENDQENI